MPDHSLPLILPPGTQVVTRTDLHGHPAGSVASIVAAPRTAGDPYPIRFADGGQAALRRDQFSIRKHYQRQGLELPAGAAANDDLPEYVIYRCVIGSRAYGLEQDGSDTDRRGVYLPPAERHWSLAGVPEQLENAERQECYWELQKFLVLALKANPNVLECLYTPLVETVVAPADELLSMRSIFLSRLLYTTYNAYVLSQFKKLEQDLRAAGTVRWKHAMHLVRLLLSGITALREGFVPLRMEPHRDRLLAIRAGETPWEAVNAWRLELHREFEAAFAATELPERPDYERVNDFLIRARRRMVNGGCR